MFLLGSQLKASELITCLNVRVSSRFTIVSLRSEFDVDRLLISPSPASDKQQTNCILPQPGKRETTDNETLFQGLWWGWALNQLSGLKWNQASYPCRVCPACDRWRAYQSESWSKPLLSCSSQLPGTLQRGCLWSVQAPLASTVDWHRTAWSGCASSVIMGGAVQRKTFQELRVQGDRMGQIWVAGLVGPLAGPHLEASHSVKHPRTVLIDFFWAQFVWMQVDYWCCGTLEAHISKPEILSLCLNEKNLKIHAAPSLRCLPQYQLMEAAVTSVSYAHICVLTYTL